MRSALAFSFSPEHDFCLSRREHVLGEGREATGDKWGELCHPCRAHSRPPCPMEGTGQDDGAALGKVAWTGPCAGRCGLAPMPWQYILPRFICSFKARCLSV